MSAAADIARFPLQTVGVGGGRVVGYRAAGPAGAPAVVCLHGIGSNAAGYRHVLAGLSDAHRVVAWDAPGYGGSTPLAVAEPDAEPYAEALAAFADALGLDRFHLVGSSFGGALAAAFAALRPDRLLSLTLCAPSAGYAGADPARRAAQLRMRIEDITTLGPAGVGAKRAHVLVAPGTDPAVVAEAQGLVAAATTGGYIQAAHMLDRTDLLALAPAIRTPTLVLCGTADRVTPVADHAARVHRAIPGAHLVVLAGVGHMIKLEAPDALVARLRAHAAAAAAAAG